MKLRHKFAAAAIAGLGAAFLHGHPGLLHDLPKAGHIHVHLDSKHARHLATGHSAPGARACYLALRHAGFTRDQAINMTAVAGVESNWNPWAHNPVPPDDSYGEFQINYYGSLRASRTRWLGSPSWMDGHLDREARDAHKLFAADGYGPWEPDFTSGKVATRLPEARAAAR